MVSKAEGILNSVFDQLGLVSDEEKYAKIYEIIAALEIKNTEEKISVSTTGKITETFVEIALKMSAKNSFLPVTQKNFQWVGDFALLGIPFNVIISVKSFKAKERLLVSGSGSSLAPTIGYGWFNDPTEFTSVKRLQAYKLRGFTAIYMPRSTRDAVSGEAKMFCNLNGKNFLRLIEDFPTDLAEVMEPSKHFKKSDTRFADPFKL